MPYLLFVTSGRFRSRVNSMAISHDLSSEIATALLAAKDRSPRELEDLKEVLLLVHSTLQRLTDEARLKRLKPQAAARQVAAGR